MCLISTRRGQCCSPNHLCKTFIYLFLFCHISEPLKVLEPFQWYLREDFQYLGIPHGRRDRISLTHIDSTLKPTKGPMKILDFFLKMFTCVLMNLQFLIMPKLMLMEFRKVKSPTATAYKCNTSVPRRCCHVVT